MVLQVEEYFHHNKNIHTIKILKFYMTIEKILLVHLETVVILFVVVNRLTQVGELMLDQKTIKELLMMNDLEAL